MSTEDAALDTAAADAPRVDGDADAPDVAPSEDAAQAFDVDDGVSAPPVDGQKRPSLDPLARTEVLSAGGTVASTPAPEPGPVYPEGTIIGDRYLLAEHISSGGFGSVYKARDTSIEGHHVALKILHVPAQSEDARETALRELRLIASVSHPSVVQFKDYGWIDGRLWFTMPWYRGHTLKQRLGGDEQAERASLTRAEARPIFERLAMGLAAMHEVGIRHNDIKPDNIFVALIAGFEGGLPVLLDLGIAAPAGELPPGFTADYVAPETAAAALGEPTHPVDTAADVFSLALALRNALEPETALELEDDNAVAFLRRRALEPVPLPERRDLRFLRADLARWLHLDPERRPTAEAFAKELARLTEPEEKREARLRTMRRVAPFAVLALVVVGVLAYQVTQQREVLTEQQERLTEQERKARVLRAQAQNNLNKLETQMAKVGEQAAELREAIRIGRGLERQLRRSEDRVRSLRGQLRRARNDIQGLEGQRDTLTKERDQLTARRDELLGLRDRLRGELQSLEAQHRELTAERNRLADVRDRLITDRQALQASNAALEKEIAQVRAKDADLQAKLVRAQRDLQAEQEARQQLEAQIAALRTEQERLRAALSRAQARPARRRTPEPRAESPRADEPTADQGQP